MLKTAIEALRAVQLASAAVEVTYRPRGGGALALRIETRDFIVPRELLPSEPQVGDEVDFLGGTYEVLSPNGEPAWRWSDPFRTAYRIHTKHVGG